MDELGAAGKLLFALGVILAAFGIVLMLGGNLPWIGKLPGDINVDKGNFSFRFPLGTSILISVILTILFSLFGRK